MVTKDHLVESETAKPFIMNRAMCNEGQRQRVPIFRNPGQNICCQQWLITVYGCL